MTPMTTRGEPQPKTPPCEGNNWPWAEMGRPSDRASSTSGGAPRPRIQSRSPRRSGVDLQPTWTPMASSPTSPSAHVNREGAA